MIDKNTIPAHWEVKTVGEVCEFEYGKALKKENRNESGGYDVFGSNGLVGKHSDFIINEPCIIVGRKGAAGEVHLSLNPCWPIDTTYFIRQKSIYDLKFLFYQLKSLQLNSLDKSTAIPGLNRNDAYQKTFVFPPFSEQKEIVAKIEELLSELDKGKEQLETARQQLKVYRQAVLKWAFEGKLTNPEVNEGELPEGWEYTGMGEIIEKPKYGTSKKCDYEIKGVPVLRIPNIGDSIVDTTDLKFAAFEQDEINSYKLKEGDLLTIRSNGSVDLVGKCALITKKDEEYLYAGYLIRLRPLRDKVTPKFLLHVLSSSNLRIQIESKAKSTSGVNNINTDELKSLILPLPSLEEQNQIVQEIESRLSVCDKVEETITQSLQQAETLRQSILKRAFEGKLINELIYQSS